MTARTQAARVICADPPWSFQDSLPGKTRGAVRQYSTLSLAEICTFPLPPLAADCYLFLWRVAAMQLEALAVCKAWGFVPKSELVWIKRTATNKPWFGMGRHVRAAHESCIIATRGRPARTAANIRSVFRAPVGRHSEKPTRFYEIVEQFAAGPYVELFARRRRPNWICYGDQLPSEQG
jgi:N6-adenosine-specific RNA methylase IME4